MLLLFNTTCTTTLTFSSQCLIPVCLSDITSSIYHSTARTVDCQSALWTQFNLFSWSLCLIGRPAVPLSTRTNYYWLCIFTNPPSLLPLVEVRSADCESPRMLLVFHCIIKSLMLNSDITTIPFTFLLLSIIYLLFYFLGIFHLQTFFIFNNKKKYYLSNKELLH